jgi:hypothetical protein
MALGLLVGAADGFALVEGALDTVRGDTILGIVLGAILGVELGAAVGTLLGDVLGVALGSLEGMALGLLVGAADGFALVEGALDTVGGDTILGVVLGAILGIVLGAILGIVLGAILGVVLGVAVGAGVSMVEKSVKTMDISASSFEIELTVIARVSPVFPLKSSNVKVPPASSSATRKDTLESLVVSFFVINTWFAPSCVCEFMPLAAL